MHQPRPRGLHVEGGALTDEDSAAIELLARRLTNQKTLSGIDSLRMVRALPDGGYVIAQDMGGTFRTIAHKPVGEEADRWDGYAQEEVPMLFSGVVSRPIVIGPDGIGLKLTEQTRRRLAGYESEELPRKDVALQRFRIDYNPMVSEFKPRTQGAAFHSQYAAQRPSWYSGAMAEVMQIVGGYGRQDFEALPDDPVERARMRLPASVVSKVRNDLRNLILPGYTGVPPRNGQFQFEYKFHDTNGVAFDSSRKPWLVRVSIRGVFAMPLPMIPATTTAAFREYIEEVGDSEILWSLDRFGGLPSGEGFPARIEDFESWRRAGVIIKVCDTADFYQHYMYASSCGWSFNESGTEGFNTCYDYDPADWVQMGLAYKLSLRLGEAEHEGKLPTAFDLDDPVDARLLDQYLSAVYRQLTPDAKGAAIKYKLRRVPISDLLARARGAVSSNAPPLGEIEHWDRLEQDPIATHGGNVAQVAVGNLWAPGPPRTHPQIKFPEPFMQGCVSHDFSPAERGTVPQGYIVRCNTIMFGYYIGDDLKVVKYFYDQRQYVHEVEDNYEDCMIVGAWERIETSGVTSIRGHFYTSDIDEREAKAPTTTVTKTVGTDLGYDTKPHFSFDHYFAMTGSMWRNRYFQHHVVSDRSEGYSLTLAVCMPYFERNACLHAKTEDTTRGIRTESLSVHAVQDPNSYRYFTYDFIWAWLGGDSTGNAGTALNVSPYPKDGNPVWVTGYNYNPGGCSDFADQGDWVGGLPSDYTWLIHPNRHEWLHSGGGGRPTVKEYVKTETFPSKTEGELLISASAQVRQVNKDPRLGYFTISPSEFGNVFYVDSVRICAGESVYQNCFEADPQASGQRKRWGFTSLVDNKSAHHFIGVINE